MSIKIPVSADFNSEQLEQKIQQINRQIAAMGAAVAKASGQKFEPITLQSKKDLDYFLRQSQQLLKIQGELNKRMSTSGQSGKTPFEANWSKMYLDEKTRTRRMREALVFMGASFEDAHAPVPPSSRPSAPVPPASRPNAPRAPGALGGMFTGVAQAGLRATGPAGGVAAGALGTGMAVGAGAGLVGLLGGLAALGVGKLIGSVTEKMDQAEANAVAYDRLKRTLGDVNVSFNGLKSVVESAAKNTSITFDEAARLGTQFTKLANLSTDQHGQLGGELGMGVGMSRAYGLDPAAGVGLLGSMRGIGVTRDEQSTRKFALLIGETIGKAGAFAKADEVMEAVAGFATMQTRNSMGAANVGGFGGLFSSLASSGIPGLDPAGAGSLIGRINASLAGGGAKGEASQFFTGMVGRRMGLDPLQTQILREGGAFATNNEAFGDGSIAARYGISGPGGNQTFLQGSMNELRRQYGGNKGMLAQATANHLGIGMRQAMALLSVAPNQMGEMEQYAGDLTKLSGSGIGNLSKALYGGAGDRASLADSLRRRTGADSLSTAELAKLDSAMSSGNAETQKSVLAELVASRDQERTQGSDIRDSKNALDNIKTMMADRLIPLTNEMRHGIMYLAGEGGKVSPSEIMQKVMESESSDRQRAIKGKYDGLISEQGKKIVDARMNEDPFGPDAVAKGEISARIQAEANAEINRLKQEQADKLEEENELLQRNIDALRADMQKRLDTDSVSSGGSGYGPSRRFANGSGRGGAGSGALSAGGAGDRGEAMDYFMKKGWTRSQAAGIVANLAAESGLRHTAVGDNGAAYGVAQWHPDRQAAFQRWSGKNIREATREEQYAFVHHEMTEGAEKAAGDRLRRATTAGDAGSIVSKHYERPKHREAEALKRARMANEIEGTPLPKGGSAGIGTDQKVIFGADPITILHQNERGEQVRPPEQLATRVRQAIPFGASA